MGIPTQVQYSKDFRRLPKTRRGYFFAHFKYFARALRHNPQLWKIPSIVLFTHPNWDSKYTSSHVVYVLNQAYRVICLNTAASEKLAEMGVEREKLAVGHMAADPGFFLPHRRTSTTVGLSMAYYERKNPWLLLDIIQSMPQVRFLLVGTGWQKFERFDELIRCPNLDYKDSVAYRQYPDLYRQMSVFLSTSRLEGGPVPLLEAMMANVYPVVSATGFAPDIIRHGENGYLFPIDADAATICPLIEKAFANTTDVRGSVVGHSWKNYAQWLEQLYQTV
jgi:glycosyltransferase involved in cell wall biosynthesis